MRTKNISPTGSSVVCPCLRVESAESQIEFLVKVFDASIIGESKDESGFIYHAEIGLYDTTIMVSKSNTEWPSIQGDTFVYVEHVEEMYARAVSHGAISTMKPVDRPYGMRVGGFRDQAGNTWWVAQLIKQ